MADALAVRQQVDQGKLACSCEYADTITAAREKLAAHVFDCLILHVGMVDDTIPLLLADLTNQGTPFIAVAPVGQEDAVIHLMQQGAVDYLIQDSDDHYLKLIPIALQKAIALAQPSPPVPTILQPQQPQEVVTTITDNHDRSDKAQSNPQEQLLEGQRQVLELLALDTPLPEILTLLVELVEEQGNGQIASILLLDGQHLHQGIAPSLPDEYVQAVNGIEIGPQVASCGTAAFYKEPVVVTDIATDPRWQNYRDLALQHGLRACWSVPIFSKSGSVLGTFTLYHRQPYTPNAEDWKLVNIAVNLAALAIERKQTEQSLHESEERFRATFEQAAIGICHVAPAGQFLRFNRRFCEISGYTERELQSLTFQAITYPEDLPADLHNLHHLLQGQISTYVSEKRYIRKDRTVIWGNLTVSLVRDDAGEPSYLIGIVEDITDRKEAAVKLYQSEQRYATLAAAAPVGIFRTDEIGYCVYVNDRWCQIAGLSSDQAMGSGWLEAIHPEDRNLVFTEWEAATQTGQPFRLEYRFQRPDGTSSWVFAQAVAEYDTKSNITGFVGTITDITERVRLDTERRQAEAALHQLNWELERRVEERTTALQQTNRQLQYAIAERQRLAALVENSTDFIATATPSGQLTYLNRAGRQLIGLDVAADITSYSMADFHHPDDWAELQQTMLPAINRGETWQGELPLRHCQTGAAIPIMHSSFPIKHPKTGKTLAIAGILRDSTKQKQIEQQLHDLTERLTLAVTAGGIGIWEWDIPSNQLIWDDRMYELYGIQQGELTNVYDGWLQALHPDDRTEAAMILEQALRGEREFNPEFRVIHADGSIHYIQAYALIQRDPAGEPLRMVGLNFDITDRKQAEVALRGSEERWQLAVAGANDGIWDWNVQANTVFLSSRWKEMRGFSEADNNNSLQEWLDGIHPDDYEAVMGGVTHHFAGNTEFFEMEYRVRCKDGSYKWILDRGKALRDGTGQVIRMAGSETDITQRKLAETALRESEEWSRSLMEGAGDAILLSDINGHCLTGNRKAEELLGYPREEISHLTFLQLYPLADWERHTTAFANISHTGFGQVIDTTILRKDGTLVPVDIIASVITAGNQQVVLESIRDITERKTAELALRNSEARYRAILEAVPDLLLRLRKDGTCLDCILPKGAQAKKFIPIAHHLSELLPPDQLRQQLEIVQRTLATRELQVYEHQLLKQHQPIYEEIRVAAINDDEVLIIVRDITEQKQSETALRESQAALLAAQRVAHIGNWSMDVPTQTITASAELYRIFGIDPSQPVSFYKEYLQRVHPADREALSQCIDAAIAAGTSYTIDYRVLLPDGSVRHHEGRGEAVCDQQGHVIKLYGTALDITDRKQAELELCQNRDLREAIFEESADALFIVDPDTELLTDCNERAVQLFEATAKHELINSCSSSLQCQPFSIEELNQIFLELHSSGFWSREAEYITCKGTSFWANIAGTTISVAGREVGLIRLTDITERKVIEQLLHQQLNKEQLLVSVLMRIRDSLELNTILAAMVQEIRPVLETDRILVYQFYPDYSGRVVAESCADSCQPMLNLEFSAEPFPAESFQRYVEGGYYMVADCHQVDMAECARQFMLSYQIRAKLVVPIVQQESKKLWGLLIAHQCGAAREWDFWEMGLLQQLAGQLAIAIQQADLYQQVQAELAERQRAEAILQTTNEQLHIANQELARATRLKDEFLANMSHELRTPLNAILGMSETLQEKVFGSLSDRQQKAVGTIERSGRHLLDLINDILDLAKIEAGKLELTTAPCAVQNLCTSSTNLVKQIAYQKNIQFNATIAPDLSDIELDERRMRQVLVNLLSNAIKFTPTGGSVTLEVWSQPAPTPAKAPDPLPFPPALSDHFMHFSVVDTGIGIDPDDITKLFQAFVQIDSKLNRQYNGTGLGLALVKRITELHRGWVQVESRLSQGSRFTVVIPYHPVPQTWQCQVHLPTAEAQQLIIAERVIKPSLEQQPLVLLAEDNSANVETYSNYLMHCGYRLVVATNGIEAVSLAKEHHPDIILMDIQMPDMDGLEAACQIRALPELADTPIVALTALAMPGDRERCLAAGMSEYVAKPVRLRYLANRIAQLLEQ